MIFSVKNYVAFLVPLILGLGGFVAIVQKLTLRQTLPKREPGWHLLKKLQP